MGSCNWNRRNRNLRNRPGQLTLIKDHTLALLYRVSLVTEQSQAGHRSTVVKRSLVLTTTLTTFFFFSLQF